MVDRGEFVVKTWLQTALNRAAKSMPTFADFFQSFATIRPEMALLHSWQLLVSIDIPKGDPPVLRMGRVATTG
jgi:hypothetical protein